MTAVKEGDKVRITHTYEDEVSFVYADGAILTCRGRYLPVGDDYTAEVLPPVLHVDDVVTFEDLTAAAGVADKTVVVDDEGDAWQYRDEEWYLTGDDYVRIDAEYAPFVVVYAPKVKP